MMRKKASSSFRIADISKPQPGFHTDIPRLKQGGLGMQFWSAYAPAETRQQKRAAHYVLEQIDLVHRMVKRYPNTFEMAKTADDVVRIRKAGKIASMIGVEGGHAIENSISLLRVYYGLGVRYMTLTHSDTLDWADSATDKPKSNGLSPFGEEIVKAMNRLGMLVDISHVSVDTMKDALRVSRAPVIASHSSARALADHPRNVPDDVLKLVRKNGGVIMVNYFSGFVVPESAKQMAEMFNVRRDLLKKYPKKPDFDRAYEKWKKAHPMKPGTIHDVVDHIDHIVKVAGVDHVGLGSDFDGVSMLPKQLHDVSTYPLITQALLDRGYTDEQVKKVMGGNLLRALRQAEKGKRSQTLLGVTGSGKTFTMANVIAQLQRPTLVLSHNKTLAAQLYSEFREFFPHNAVSYFVSYYDYYQPEAYIPQRDIYIEKDASINEEIDRLRLLATSALVSRRDVIVVASVSCIYGLGSPKDYLEMMIPLQVGCEIDRDELLRKLIDIQYERNDIELARGRFRVRGDVLEVWPAYEEFAYRIEMWGEEVEKLSIIEPVSGEESKSLPDAYIYPAKHFVLPQERIDRALGEIQQELDEQLEKFRKEGKLLEAQRLSARTRYDMELLREAGFCPGIENYSRALSGRNPGEPPYTLLDFFPKDFLMFIDESHVTLPQVRGMFAGDHSRKTTLVEHGFRLPMAIDNRPLKFEEWDARCNQRVLVSATPGDWELKDTEGEIVEQVIRPTGLIDPIIHIVPARGQVPHLMDQIRQRTEKNERVLVTTLTKRLSEDLTTYLQEDGIRCQWLHSELDAIERVQILRELREGKFDALVGVNLLREGLDLPEVSLVAILDADKEGFLRSATSLIQTIGRSARNVNAEVYLYADKVTDSMQEAIDETNRRRAIQEAYNKEHGITPETIRKAIRRGIEEEIQARKIVHEVGGATETQYVTQEFINELEAEMMAAAENLEFERAAQLRDRIMQVKQQIGQKIQAGDEQTPGFAGSKKKTRRRRGKRRGGRVPKPERP
eukprot:g8250.t1